MSLPLFCYGTLMVPEIMQRVTGRAITPELTASLHDYGCYKVRSETFPGVRPTKDAITIGLLYPNLSTHDIAQLDRYEGYLYQRTQVTVTADGEQLLAWCYLIKPEYFSELIPEHWCYQHFLDAHLSSFTRC